MAQWEAIWPIFEVCTGERGYEERGRRRDKWWHQEVEETHLGTTSNEILRETRRRRWVKKDR